ncbi:peptide transporter, partial [Pseudomonas laurentiana]|nr:peptide transporter [Pseudomonas laurentiana]
VDKQRRLLAFAAQPRQADAKVALRRYAEQQLPDYMRPAFYQELPNMPYTANGKVDRQALRERPVHLGRHSSHAVPRNECEQRLLTIWSALLELPPDEISCTDSFFNLGGHSILLSRLLLELRSAFGRSIPINRFIEMPTLQRMAMLLSGEDNEIGAFDPQAQRDAERTLGLQVQPIERLGDVHKIIVTGANSFLGVHIVEALLDWG